MALPCRSLTDYCEERLVNDRWQHRIEVKASKLQKSITGGNFE